MEDARRPFILQEVHEDGRRRCIMQVVSWLAIEAGFGAIEKQALATLTHLLERNIVEIGRVTKLYAEVACRVEPNLGDLTLSLIELGRPLDALQYRTYMRRRTRPVICSPLGLPPPKVPQILSAGKRRPMPPHIQEFFPPMPDPHTYIRTPTHRQPLTDYAACREKMSQQKRDLERSLSKFYARTSPCFHFFPDNKELFPIMLPKPVTYHNAVVCRDQIFEEDHNLPPINRIKKEDSNAAHSRWFTDLGPTFQVSDCDTPQTSWELIDNPFLRPTRPWSPSKKPFYLK